MVFKNKLQAVFLINEVVNREDEIVDGRGLLTEHFEIFDGQIKKEQVDVAGAEFPGEERGYDIAHSDEVVTELINFETACLHK